MFVDNADFTFRFRIVADLIGDTVEQVMKTYGHLYQEDKLNIIAKIK